MWVEFFCWFSPLPRGFSSLRIRSWTRAITCYPHYLLFHVLQIDSAWIVYNKPKDNQLTNEHAGFLMALGLNGHLTSLAHMNLHDYLSKVHISIMNIHPLFWWRGNNQEKFVRIFNKRETNIVWKRNDKVCLIQAWYSASRRASQHFSRVLTNPRVLYNCTQHAVAFSIS
jgi:hypothetical protein